MKTQCTSTKQRVLQTLGFFGLFMTFAMSVTPMYAQTAERTVAGVVNSIDGPVFGATVMLKGTAIGAISNEKGEFTFPQELQENDVLVVSYLGYETDEVTITGNTTFVKPFLEDIPIVIIAALRTKTAETSSDKIPN